MTDAEQFPRIFQANIDRFYQRVIVTVLSQLSTHADLAVGEAVDMDEFLDRCAAMVDNYTANEAAKAFALTLDGMFERQISRMAQMKGLDAGSWDKSLKSCTDAAGIDLVAIAVKDDLSELHLVANVVRHGEGRSCVDLKAAAPQLWHSPAPDYYDLAPGPTPASEELRVRPDDLRRYARAIQRFWGHLDRLPGAVLDPPY
ncbi:hypothetical protein V5F44_20645 [Xanthobacter sp. V2C-8]|uniref:hypothetical protein n=1 Tax=Xanthobacter albus TaxID=3119929 RepID=UPI003729A68E